MLRNVMWALLAVLLCGAPSPAEEASPNGRVLIQLGIDFITSMGDGATAARLQQMLDEGTLFDTDLGPDESGTNAMTYDGRIRINEARVGRVPAADRWIRGADMAITLVHELRHIDQGWSDKLTTAYMENQGWSVAMNTATGWLNRLVDEMNRASAADRAERARRVEQFSGLILTSLNGYQENDYGKVEDLAWIGPDGKPFKSPDEVRAWIQSVQDEARDPGPRGIDIAGSWTNDTPGIGRSTWTFTARPDGRWDARESGMGAATGTATFDGSTIQITWVTGVWRGTYTWTLAADGRSGSGTLAFSAGPRAGQQFASSLTR